MPQHCFSIKINEFYIKAFRETTLWIQFLSYLEMDKNIHHHFDILKIFISLHNYQAQEWTSNQDFEKDRWVLVIKMHICKLSLKIFKKVSQGELQI